MDNIAKIVDLPGIYAMDTYSNEEKVSKNYLSTENIDVILNIVDASNLERNLYLTYQLKRIQKTHYSSVKYDGCSRRKKH